MKIVGLRIENFKRLKVVHLAPDGTMVRLVGDNDQGKTSILDAVAGALGGERLCPTVPIRKGEAAAEVTVDLDELVVTRRWTKGGSTVTLRNKEGAKFPSPQKKLDEIIGRLSFDPLAFGRSTPAQQVETLRNLVGLDFSSLDNKRRAAYDNRTLINRDVATLRGSLALMPAIDAPDEPVSAVAILAEQEQIQTAHGRRLAELGLVVTDARAKLRTAAAQASAADQRHAEASRAGATATEARERCAAQIADLERQLDRAKMAWNNASAAASTAVAAIGPAAEARDLAVEDRDATAEEVAQVESARDAVPAPDLAPIRQRLADVERVNAAVAAKKAREVEAQRLAARETDSAALTKEIDAIDARKAKDLAAAQFPVPGLGFGEGCVTLDGLPLAQAGGAGRLRTTLAIGIALNKGRALQAMFIDEAGVLDQKSLAIVAEMAAAADCQVWLTMPGAGGAGDVVIDDGEVVGAEPTHPVALVKHKRPVVAPTPAPEEEEF